MPSNIQLSENLLREYNEGWMWSPDQNSYRQINGLYNPMKFVLKLHPDIHKELDSIEPGIKFGHELKFSTIQAFSTYFHETIHWSQHVGSIYGMMLSLIYPSQAHINNRYLKYLLRDIGPVKPLINFYNLSSNNDNPIILENINRVLNCPGHNKC